MTHTQNWHAAIIRIGPRTAGLLALVVGMGTLAACSSVPDEANPVEWYRSAEDAIVGDSSSSADSSSFPQPVRPDSTTTASTSSTSTTEPTTYAPPDSVPGTDEPYPNLSTVPARPETRTAAERTELQAGLVADRAQRRYSDEVISLQGSSDTELASTAPPPPPDLAPSPYTSSPAPSAATSSTSAATAAPPSPYTSSPSAATSTTSAAAAAPSSPYTSSPVPSAATSTAAAVPPPPSVSSPSETTVASTMPDSTSSMSSGSAEDLPSSPATASEEYLPPPPPREAAAAEAAAAEADVPPAYTPPYAQPAPTYSSAPSTGGPAPVTGPGGTASAPAATSAPAAAAPSVTSGVDSVYRTMLQEQSQPLSAMPPVERPVPPPVYAGSAPVAAAQGRNVGKGPGGERLVSYQPTGMSPSAAPPPGLPLGRSQHAATIQFSSGSSSLDARDRAVLRDVAQLWRERGGSLYVVGHASSTTGSRNPVEAAAINERISQRRAESVASALARYGVAGSSLLISAAGASQPQYAEVRSTGVAGNQRVEIYFVN